MQTESNAGSAVHAALGSVSAYAAQARRIGLDWLSLAERGRLASIQAPRRQEQFIAARWQVRHLLCAVYGGNPLLDWPLSSGTGGTPRLPGSDALRIGISHSGDWVACTVSARAVGIDVEGLEARRDRSALIDGVCTASEREQLVALPHGGQRAALTVLWTLKEAWLKRRDMGVDPARMTTLQTRMATAGDEEIGRIFRVPGAILSIVADHDQPILWNHTPEALTPDALHWGFSSAPGHAGTRR